MSRNGDNDAPPARPGEETAGAVREAVRCYRKRGLAVCLVRPGQKLPLYEKWPTYSREPDDFGPDDNVGLLCGAVNGNLVCVDVDGRQALELAEQHLPPTTMIDGRPGKPRSHWWYRVTNIPDRLTSTGCQVEGGPATKQFRDPQRQMIVEVRGTGAQTVVPPSVWSDGGGGRETRTWDTPGEPSVVDCAGLLAAVEKLAAAAGWDGANEPIVVACVPVAWRAAEVVEGCRKLPCLRCGRDCWVSPASLARGEAHPAGFHVVCLDCLDPGPPGDLLPPSPEQWAEARRHFARKN